MSFVFCLCLTHVMINDYQAGWKGETFVLAGRGVQLGGIATAPGIVTAEVLIYVSGAECIGRCGQLPSKGARFV